VPGGPVIWGAGMLTPPGGFASPAKSPIGCSARAWVGLSVDGSRGSRAVLFRPFDLVQAVEPVEQGQGDQRHDQPRPDCRATITLDRVHY
jgi:hypothetical protein